MLPQDIHFGALIKNLSFRLLDHMSSTVSSTCTAVSVSPQTENPTLGCRLYSLVSVSHASVSHALSSVNVCFQEGQAPLWQ